jgi:hypothetical protein
LTGKLVLWVLGLVALVCWQVFAAHYWGAEQVQGRIYVGTAVAAAVFIALYSRDPWHKSWFGRSLMMIAVSMLLLGISVVLFRLFGPDYPFRSVLIIVVADLTFAAMVARTAVLWAAQRDDEHTADPRP